MTTIPQAKLHSQVEEKEKENPTNAAVRGNALSLSLDPLGCMDNYSIARIPQRLIGHSNLIILGGQRETNRIVSLS